MRIRQHVNPKHGFFETFRGELPPFDERLVEVEIGCADAQFLFERAAKDPSRLYVGLEIRDEWVRVVNQRAKETGAPVHAVFCHAQLHMDVIFAPASIERVYVNFPDPWFKRKHQDRRMVDDRLTEQIARAVRPGAEVFVQTDVWDIAIDAMETFDGDREERFVNQAGEWTFWRAANPYGVRSWREENAQATGLSIWRLLYRRSEGPTPSPRSIES